MKSIVLSVLRIVNRILALFLPSRVHFRLRRAAKAALKEYRASAIAYVATESDSTAEERSEQTYSKKIGKDEIAEPLTEFITCGGRLIDVDCSFMEKISEPHEHQDCELVICCAFTGRHHILEQVIEESFKANETNGLRWMLVGSTPEDEIFIKAMSGRTNKVAGCIVKNRPLGRKWQTSSKLAYTHFRAELYGITGSDDILSAKLVDYIIRKHRDNKSKVVNPEFLPSLYGCIEWIICNTNQETSFPHQLIKCNYRYETVFEPLGAGRFYTRSFMEEVEGIIFESDLERLLDDRGYDLVNDLNGTLEYFTMDEGPLISVKGNWSQMNTVEAVLEATTLNAQEFTFVGHDLLQSSLSEDTYGYLFKRPFTYPQFIFFNTGNYGQTP